MIKDKKLITRKKSRYEDEWTGCTQRKKDKKSKTSMVTFYERKLNEHN